MSEYLNGFVQVFDQYPILRLHLNFGASRWSKAEMTQHTW